MNRVLELFKQITKVPRCSQSHKSFINHIQEFAKINNYQCKVDDTKNILCYKKDGNANICLQSHYDIVCLEESKIPKILETDGYLKAKDSTLGADNGIGCAMMMALMEEGKDCEFLFTSDEEIGLIGANNISFDLSSSYMLNLDSEDEGDVYIGCAGGIDICAKNFERKTIEVDESYSLYEVSIDGLAGGHSGVDIDKGIPNAIKIMSAVIKECDAYLLDINGGERINSIPRSCKAIICSQNKPVSSSDYTTITQIDSKPQNITVLPKSLNNLIYSFAQGVRGYDKELGVVLSSINLALITTKADHVSIEFSARSMDDTELNKLKEETLTLLECFGFKNSTSGKYPAWRPEHNEFAEKVLQIYKEHISSASLKAIHAGLECAILKDKYPNMKIASIGPNINFPHSCNEAVEIKSVYKVFDVLKNIVGKIS